VGAQYRSVIFDHSGLQHVLAGEAIAAAAGLWPDPIVTELSPVPAFYPAENYHQDYFRKNPTWGYCQVVVAPKVAKARKAFAERLRR